MTPRQISKDDSNTTPPNLIVDNDPTSCSKLAQDGSSVVVGSNQNGDPAAPEGASGYRLGNTVKYADKYMVVANTPLAVKAGCDVLKQAVAQSMQPLRYKRC